MPGRRSWSLASLAAAALVAGGAAFWLVSDHVAAEGEAAPGGGLLRGAPFRSTDFVRSQVNLVSTMALGGTPGGQRSHVAEASDIVKQLKARGFSDVSQIRQRGGAFVCEATGPRRERVRLVVDAVSGEITGMQVIGFADPRP